jgi:outer membrane receptor protein involved in Fe transport
VGEYRAYAQGAALYQTGATQDLNVFNNALLGNTSGFVTFDISAGVKKDNWTVDVFMQNVFDKRGVLTTNTFCSITFCSGSSRNFPTKPQFFGVRFGQTF